MIIGRDSASGPALNMDRAALVEERDFLLRSLRDLEAEHGVGDIGDVDYQNLRDDYTARAAAVLRTLAAEPSNGRNGSGPERVAGTVEAGDSAKLSTVNDKIARAKAHRIDDEPELVAVAN